MIGKELIMLIDNAVGRQILDISRYRSCMDIDNVQCTFYEEDTLIM